jgi:hypothetical protein
MSTSCECCVLSGRGLCDEVITRPEESYRLWCVVVCDLENLKNEKAMTCVGSQSHRKNKLHLVGYFHNYIMMHGLTNKCNSVLSLTYFFL